MKKKLFSLLPLLLLGLAACNNGGNGGSSGGGGGGGGASSFDPAGDVEYTIVCYIDYNHTDEDNPYHTAEWRYNEPFTKEDIELVDPKNSDANYAEFGTFKGWSLHPIIDSDDQLLDFGTYVKEQDGSIPFMILYGIWVDAA